MMKNRFAPAACGLALIACVVAAQAATTFHAQLDQYEVRALDATELGPVPALEILRNGQRMMRVPLISGLDTPTEHEHLSELHADFHAGKGGPRFEITVSAKSSLWPRREFHWRLYADHLEFDQSAWGDAPIGRSYIFADGVSGRWDKGGSDGAAWNTTLWTDRYWTPSSNHANEQDLSIAEPEILGFDAGERGGSEEDFRPRRMGNLFSPPPLMLAYQRQGEWAGIGLGTEPGLYRFGALEYSGSRYAGAAWWVDYLGYQTPASFPGGHFHSPVAAIHFGYSALDTLAAHADWVRHSGFGTPPSHGDVAWHHLPIFCGWAEQTSSAVPKGQPANAEATQANYEAWLAELDRRGLPVGTVVIDDKWQKGYGSFDVDTAKWPDLKGFVARQHAKGRHVLLWVPVAHAEGLPPELCVSDGEGHCLAPRLGDPAYEAFLRARLKHLVADLGVDGFKEDWVWAPVRPGMPVPPFVAGMEGPRLFQHILYSEAHRWKPDALVETQTAHPAFRDSSDVIRLNDVWYAERRVTEMMRDRARVAHIAGWPLVDTDNASSTTLDTWWTYMQAQPSIGIPALYFVRRTESTLESPPDWAWAALAGMWKDYVQGLSPVPF